MPNLPDSIQNALKFYTLLLKLSWWKFSAIFSSQKFAHVPQSPQNNNKAFFRYQNVFTNTPKSRKNPSNSKWMNEEKTQGKHKIFLIFRFPFIIINNFCFQGKAWKARTQIHSQSFFGRLLLLFVCVILYGRCGIFDVIFTYFFRSTMINLNIH